MHSRRLVLAACMLACVGVCAAAPGTQEGSVQITDAWVRWLPGELPAGGYLTLINSGDRPSSLIAASCPDYAEVSLHRSRNVAGTARMMPVHDITVAAHSTLAFAAQGYHLMLLHPSKPLKPGDRVPVTLSFADGSRLTVLFELRPPAAGAEMPGQAGMSDMAH
jgi:periplasmic copper chaperone A